MSTLGKVVRIYQHGDPSVLRLEDAAIPAPSAGHVRLRVRAIGLNRSDTHVRSGSYSPRHLPASLGFEAAGMVESVGAGVDSGLMGKAVAVIPLASADYTTYGELINVPAALVRVIPAPLSFVQAAALWVGHLTAYGPLLRDAALSARDHVVITAPSSCVGLAAIQIANAVGATSIAVTRHRNKKQALRQAGAAHVIVLEDDDLQGRLDEITIDRGPRVIFDLVAGGGLGKLLTLAAPGGIALLCGVLDREAAQLPAEAILSRGLTLKGCVLAETIGQGDLLEQAKAFIEQHIAAGHFHPIIARTFPLEQISHAHTYLESNEQIGKVVVTVGSHP